MKKLNVLVACEYSGVVRDAFEDAGCNAWSCDILPTESEQTQKANKHVRWDIRDVMREISAKNRTNEPFWIEEYAKLRRLRYGKNFPKKWDIMIAHPPCTYLSFAYTGKDRYSVERLQKKIESYKFFMSLWSAPIEYICIENPLGYIHSGLLPYTQIVEPYYFGDPYTKRTCLWLKNLPKLTYYKPDIFGDEGGGTVVSPQGYFYAHGAASRSKYGGKSLLPPFSSAKERSKFHAGMAKAMAEQWTTYIINKKDEKRNKENNI